MTKKLLLDLLARYPDDIRIVFIKSTWSPMGACYDDIEVRPLIQHTTTPGGDEEVRILVQ